MQLGPGTTSLACARLIVLFALFTASTLAFTCALSMSKDLQAALALAQGAHEVA